MNKCSSKLKIRQIVDKGMFLRQQIVLFILNNTQIILSFPTIMKRKKKLSVADIFCLIAMSVM